MKAALSSSLFVAGSLLAGSPTMADDMPDGGKKHIQDTMQVCGLSEMDTLKGITAGTFFKGKIVKDGEKYLAVMYPSFLDGEDKAFRVDANKLVEMGKAAVEKLKGSFQTIGCAANYETYSSVQNALRSMALQEMLDTVIKHKEERNSPRTEFKSPHITLTLT